MNITSPFLTRPLTVSEAQALVDDLTEKLKQPEFLPGYFYRDQDGKSYLCKIRLNGVTVLWQLSETGATHAPPDYWINSHGRTFTPQRTRVNTHFNIDS